MFGHSDDQGNNDNAAPQHVDPAPDGALTHDGNQPGGAPTTTVAPDTDAGSFIADDMDAPTPVKPDQPHEPHPTPSAPEPTPEPAPTPASTSTPASGSVPKPATPADELLNIKQQALQQLSPLVGHLDQTPEEKFRTTMMMIQAADNDTLIKAAYDAAQAIPDEKARAQALLDIVNEINYFTQHQNNDNES